MNRRVVYFSHMFLRVWLGLGVLVVALGLWLPIGVFAQATIGGECVARVPDHTCTDVTSLSAADRTARDCQTGRCPGLPAGVLCCRAAAVAAPAAAAALDALRCEQYICTLGEGYSNETLTSLPSSRPGEVTPSYVCTAALDISQACQRSCEYACSLYRRGEPGITTPYRCAPTYRPRCFGTTPAAPAAAASTTARVTSDPGIAGRLGLPPCAVSHDPSIAGRCTLDDIKTVAVNFANFLMGLAAAFFLAIFVWAGFKYIFFAYDSGVAADARKTLVSAAIGMLLVLGAATIVRFVSSAATGGSSSSSSSKSSAPTAPSR